MINRPRYINAGGSLLDLTVPRVMGIINITPDSFYTGSRYQVEKSVLKVAAGMASDGADIIDIGGLSTRPGSEPVPADEERKRVTGALEIIRKELPDLILSVDTYRSSIAREAVEKYGVQIINDVSGGEADKDMFAAVAELKVTYILMHMQGIPGTMQVNPLYDDVVADILKWFAPRIKELHCSRVKDIIIDPGFGFGKTLAHNFELLRRLNEFSIAGLPVLAGLSRKSLVWKTLGVSPSEALNGTTSLNMLALCNGADILRVHDVKEAVQTVKLFLETHKPATQL